MGRALVWGGFAAAANPPDGVMALRAAHSPFLIGSGSGSCPLARFVGRSLSASFMLRCELSVFRNVTRRG